MKPIAVIILTHNEERHIARAMQSVALFAHEIVVVDSYSTDRTIEIAKAGGAEVLQNRFVNYARQFQWALDNASISSPWIMRLDADEVVEAPLAAEIVEKVAILPDTVVGINLKRKHIFLGRWIRHGGRYPLVLLRIWRRGQGRIENRWMDEHMIVWGGSTVTFDGDFADHNLNDLTYFTEKHNKYATREAIDILNQRMHLFPRDDNLTVEGTSRQASLKRAVKERVYNHLPFYVSALSYFVWRYFFQLGFLDGRPGLVYHFLQGYWYRFLVGTKVMELEASIRKVEDKEAALSVLERLTGFRLSGN
jgi:glycosyltransferase involved in cell wall biosynthesis